jgi:putative OPT family oligopeptide transporter
MKTLSDKAKMVFNFEAETFILGMGYVMGLRSSMILCAGGVLANFALVPLIWMIGQNFPDLAVYPGAKPIAAMTAANIFRAYVRLIGVGAIATAGIFGIIKSLKIIFGSFSIAAKTFKAGSHGTQRTERDMNLMINLGICLIVCLAIAFFFSGLSVTTTVLVLGLLLFVGFAFFFATVAANAIATTARNPISGMTMLTIIVSSAVLLQFGLTGTTGMFFVMAIAGMLCTAVSMSGQFITDLKTGYWLGSTPVRQQYVKIIGVIVAALAAGLSIVMLAKVFQFGEAIPGDIRPVLASPQAAIMKTLVQGFMSNQPIAYILFGVGIMISIVLEMLGVSPLVFALGMYLPLELNTPCLVGGFIAHLVTKRSNKIGGHAGSVIRERGVIIASGLMAGGALGGVFGAALRLFPWYKEELIKTPWFDNDMWSQLVSIALFVLACLYIWFSSNNKKAIAKMN